MVDDCFKLLRNNFRLHGSLILDHIKRNHFDPDNFAGEDDICSFCGKNNELTKEHVIPKWCFQNDPERCFETVINGTTQAFIKTTIPACSTCNNDTLSKVERYTNNLFQNTNLDTDYYEYGESLNIIRWLEIIEYKFYILNFRRKFRRKQFGYFILILRDIPMSVMRININFYYWEKIPRL